MSYVLRGTDPDREHTALQLKATADTGVRVVLGGRDITNACRAVTVKMQAGEIIEATLVIFPEKLEVSIDAAHPALTVLDANRDET